MQYCGKRHRSIEAFPQIVSERRNVKHSREETMELARAYAKEVLVHNGFSVRGLPEDRLYRP